MTDKEIKNEIRFKRELAESYLQMGNNSENNPEQFYGAFRRISKEADELQRTLDESKEIRDAPTSYQ